MATAESAVLLALAAVLVAAAVSKLAERIALEPILELAVAALVVFAPGRIAGLAVAALFAAFAAVHVRDLAAGRAGCDCFGADSGRAVSPARAGALTGVSALAALGLALAGAPSLAHLAGADPGALPAVIAGALAGAAVWRLAFRGRPGAAADALVTSSAHFIERRFSRRSLLERVALTGTALAVAPVRFLLYPGTALAAIVPGDCGGGLCTDGYTAFCCEINGGYNTCPVDTFPGGWWMCTDYPGSRLCADAGLRYYVDCNAMPGTEFPGGCRCAGGTCDNRRVACNVFRYGQCNTQIAGVTAVVCRMVVCENPSTLPELNCSSSVAVDDAVCAQDAACLEPALELAGAGGV